MAAQDGLTFEGVFNNGSTGLFKPNTTKAIGSDDLRALVTAIKESYLNRIDDAYMGAKGQRAGVTTPAGLKPIVTTTLTTGTLISFVDSSASNVLRIYELTSGTSAENSPIIIRPNDYAGTSNEKIWTLRVTADTDSDTGGGGGGVGSVAGTTNRITSTGGSAPVIDIDAAYDALWAAAIAPYKLDSATPSTAGGTITLDFNSQVQRMFVGSASFAGAKAIALSNNSVALVLNLVLTLTNVAAVLTFPSTFTMSTADTRWADAGHTFTPQIIGKYEFSATFDGTDWNLKVAGPYS